MVNFQPHYTDSERHNAQRHRQTDDNIVPREIILLAGCSTIG